MTFFRTQDLALVKGILTHPRIYPWILEDGAPESADFEPNPDPRIWYVLVRDGGVLLGLLTFAPQSAVCWDVHVALLPVSWGPQTVVALSGGIRWMFSQTSARRIVGAVSVRNKRACRLALRAGLEVYGVNAASWLKHGELHDQVLFGISQENP